MNSKILAISLNLVVLVLTACGGSGPRNTVTLQRQEHSEEEFNQDNQKLNAAEKNMDTVGFRFTLDFSYLNGQPSQRYSWDASRLQQYYSEHTDQSPKDATSVLQNYMLTAQQYFGKYGFPYNLVKDDGTIEASQLSEADREQLQMKIAAAQKTIIKLNQEGRTQR